MNKISMKELLSLKNKIICSLLFKMKKHKINVLFMKKLKNSSRKNHQITFRNKKWTTSIKGKQNPVYQFQMTQSKITRNK